MTKLNQRKLQQLKNEEDLQEIVKAFTYVEGEEISFEKFDETPEVEDTVGVNHKVFVRCNPLKLVNFIDSLKKDTSYIVPCREVVREGLIPENISVIVKRGNKRYVIREVVGSQILNLFGVNTCFNCATKLKTANSEFKEMISVDMIAENEKLFTFYELKPINEWGFCESQLEVVKEMLSDKNLKNHKVYLSKEQKEKIISDYVYAHLVRRVLLYDDDFGTRNCGILYNRKAGQVKLVNFDYEYVADPKNVNRSDIVKDIKYISENYPDEYKRFLQKVKKINQIKGSLYGLIDNYEPTKPNEWGTGEIMKDFLDKMFVNIDKIMNSEKSKKNVISRFLGLFSKER